jgi:sn-glycerol 3-phosphate transport system ATP-binding protein
MSDIVIAGVRKSYGRNEVVRGLDLAVRGGEFVVILGPSGCGKSTLLRMIAGLEDITAGEIAIGGQVVNRLEPRERGCAMVFQNYALYPHMTVAENIGYALKVSGMPKADRLARIREVATTLGIADFLDRKPAQLSGGQRQRVAMGRAMIRQPRVFLFDEPLSNLDARLRVQMRIEIRKLHNRLGTTSVFVTHDQVEAMTLADKLVVMNEGRIEQVGTPSEVYRSPATRFVAGFIGAPPMNLVEGVASSPSEVTFGGVRLALRRRDLDPGRPLVVGIRPEDCMPVDGRTEGGLAMDVDFHEELGAVRLLHGKLGGEDFVAQAEASAHPPSGAWSFSVAPDAIHLFDAKDGKALATGGGSLRTAA